MTLEEKSCLVCGTMFRQHPDDGPKRWAARKYCSRGCSAKGYLLSGQIARGELPGWPDMQQRRALAEAPRCAEETKVCAHCGATMRRGNIRAAEWLTRQYCNRRCRNAYHNARRGELEHAPAKPRKPDTKEAMVTMPPCALADLLVKPLLAPLFALPVTRRHIMRDEGVRPV